MGNAAGVAHGIGDASITVDQSVEGLVKEVRSPHGFPHVP